LTDAYTTVQEQVHLAQAYHMHHFQCRACIAAGIRNGQRCQLGAPLWAAYQESVQ
jgi:hypothetical protein